MMVFILGFLSGALAAIIAAASLQEVEEPRRKPKRWTSIKEVELKWTFEHDFPGNFKPTDVLRELPEVLVGYMKKNPPLDDGATVEAGLYTVEMLARARFVGREKEPEQK